MGGTENVECRRNKVVIATVIYKETDSKHYSLYKWYIAVRYEMILRIMKFSADVKSEMKFAIEGKFHWKKRPEKGRFFSVESETTKTNFPLRG